MKSIRWVLIPAAMVLCISPVFQLWAEPVDQRENIQNYIKHSDFVVDTCIYEQEWIPATPGFPMAKLVKRAVVTGVHKGNIQVGTKIEYYHLIEEPPELFKSFRSVVNGELRTFFFSRSDGKLADGKYTLEGDGHFGFDRLNGDFAEAFRKELEVNANPESQNEHSARGNRDRPRYSLSSHSQ